MEHIWTSVVSTDVFLNEQLLMANLGKVTWQWPKLLKHWCYC